MLLVYLNQHKTKCNHCYESGTTEELRYNRTRVRVKPHGSAMFVTALVFWKERTVHEVLPFPKNTSMVNLTYWKSHWTNLQHICSKFSSVKIHTNDIIAIELLWKQKCIYHSRSIIINLLITIAKIFIVMCYF